jgi:TIGR00159 family protein
MLLKKMGITFQIKDAIDIILVAILMYLLYTWTRGTGAKNIFIGLITFVVTWFFVTRVFKMDLLGAIFDGIFNVGAFAIIVIFQNEIRQFFSRIGSRNSWKYFIRFLERVRLKKKGTSVQLSITPLADACRNMVKEKVGALIVIARKNNLQEYIDTGEVINAKINTRLIENIFFKNSPLHDGAVIIADNKIVSAGAILPLSRSHEIPKHLGLRHRAAIGLSERTDAIVIVLSEETGNISLVSGGIITQKIPPQSLDKAIEDKLMW